MADRPTLLQLIFDGYDSEITELAVRPKKGETIHAYLRRFKEAGDTLFLFVLRELMDLDDTGNPELLDDACYRLERAVDDLEGVRITLRQFRARVYGEENKKY